MNRTDPSDRFDCPLSAPSAGGNLRRRFRLWFGGRFFLRQHASGGPIRFRHLIQQPFATLANVGIGDRFFFWNRPAAASANCDPHIKSFKILRSQRATQGESSTKSWPNRTIPAEKTSTFWADDGLNACRRMKALEPPDSLFVHTARKWLEMGNRVAAQQELDHVAPEFRSHPDVLEVT